MSNSTLIQVKTKWRETIEQLRSQLETLSNELVNKEAELAERLVAIGAFEFKLRSRIGKLSRKLTALEEEVQQLRRRLERLQWWDDTFTFDAHQTDGWSIGSGAAAEGSYRYREKVSELPQVALEADEAAEMKKLYRQLARRFHPDLAVDERDHAYRTQLMMAINTAYAAGDLEKLKSLALEPDAAQHIDETQSGRQIAEGLQREIDRVQRRLSEIQLELHRLSQHQSSKMMQQAEWAAARGRDFFAEKAEQLHAHIAAKMAERDHLLAQIESVAEDIEGTAVGDVDLAELIRNVTLEQTYGPDPSVDFDDWIRRRRDPYESEDDILDDLY